MISSVFDLLICSGHTWRSRAQGPAPKAKTRFPEQGPKLAWGEESGKQSGAVPPGRRIGPKRCLRRAGRCTEVQAAGMPHSMDRMRMPVRSARKQGAMRCQISNVVGTGRRFERAIPRCANCEARKNRVHRPDRRDVCPLPPKALELDLGDSHHNHHSNAWSALKRTMVNPRGLTVSSLFFTVSRKT